MQTKKKKLKQISNSLEDADIYKSSFTTNLEKELMSVKAKEIQILNAIEKQRELTKEAIDQIENLKSTKKASPKIITLKEKALGSGVVSRDRL